MYFDIVCPHATRNLVAEKFVLSVVVLLFSLLYFEIEVTESRSEASHDGEGHPVYWWEPGEE